MNKRIGSLLTVVGFIGLISFLFYKSAQNGAVEFAAVEKLVRTINQRNSDLDAAVLSLRLGFVHNFDELTRCELAFSKSVFLDVKSSHLVGPTAEIWNEFRPLVEKKTMFVSDFKADHSVVRNAVAGFHYYVRKASNELVEVDEVMVRELTLLGTLGSRFVVTGGGADHDAFEEAIQKIEQGQTSSPLRETADCATLKLALKHARQLIARRAELDNSIEKLVSLPINDRVMSILNIASAQRNVLDEKSAWYRAGLLAAIVVLIAFCISQFVLVIHQRERLRLVNSHLDQQVEERTRELTQSNTLLEHKTEEAEKLALVARHTDNGVIITDERMNILWVNHGFCSITGFPAGEAIGNSALRFLVGTDTDSDHRNAMLKAFNQHSSLDISTVNRRKNGEVYWVDVEARPIVGSDGELVRYVIIEKDISERVTADLENQRLQQKLLNASREAGMAEIATGVLHNVGNILNSVNVSASLIQRQLANSSLDSLEKVSHIIGEYQNTFSDFVRDDARGRAIPNYILKVTETLLAERHKMDSEFGDLLRNVEHIKEVVTAQQSFAKPSAPLQMLNPQELVRDTVSAIKALLQDRNTTIEQSIDGPVPEFESDKHRILQILINLVKNASEAFPENDTRTPRVWISVSANDAYVTFRVSDNGIGIPSENLTKVFQHGFTTKKRGHGFGLHSCANAAVELGGNLTVTSDGLGKGATFMLNLPLKKKPPRNPQRTTTECNLTI